MRHLPQIMILTLSLAACASGHVEFPTNAKTEQDIPEGVTLIRLDATNIARFSVEPAPAIASSLPAARNWEYRIGVGDVLEIMVFDNADFNLTVGGADKTAPTMFTVRSDGQFFYPYAGMVDARNKTPEQVREALTTQLQQYITTPQVQLQVANFVSQGVTVAGEVGKPGRLPLSTAPLSLLDAINAAGASKPTGDLSRVTVLRAGRLYPVDVNAYLVNGVPQNNPVLRPGDVVTVPQRSAQEVYVLGAIPKPGAISIADGPISLTQALARQGGVAEAKADARGVFVFRGNGHVKVYQLDLTTPEGLVLGTKFELAARDIVYVTSAPLTKWNEAVSRLLPTVRATSAVNDAVNP